MVHNLPELHVAPEVALEQSAVDEAYLLGQRKLVLLFDLDQTLIHSTDAPTNVGEDVAECFRYAVPNTRMHYTTKIRPHAVEMLRRLRQLFELHICTFGNRPYAHKVGWPLASA